MHTRHQSTHFSVEELRPPIHDVAKVHSDQNRVLITYKCSFSVIDHDLSYASINSVVAQLYGGIMPRAMVSAEESHGCHVINKFKGSTCTIKN